MKVGASDGHVAQAGHAEHEEIVLGAGVQEAAEVDLADIAAAGEVVGEDADLLEKVSAEVAALVAAYAAEALEETIAGLLDLAQGDGVATQILEIGRAHV